VAARLVGGVMDNGVIARHMHGLAVFGRPMIIHRLAAGKTSTRTSNRDHAAENGAKQRQKDNRLNHNQPFIRLMSSTAIEPRLRK